MTAEAKPTPGPYKAGYPEDDSLEEWTIWGEGSFSFAIIHRDGGDLPTAFVIAEDWGDEGLDKRKTLVLDAFNIHHETGLTPRQLLEQRDELLGALVEARAALHQHYVDWDGEPEDAVPLQVARSKCDAAIAKAGGAK